MVNWCGILKGWTRLIYRRMFPTVKARLHGLERDASYIVFLDIVPVDDKRYRYVYHR